MFKQLSSQKIIEVADVHTGEIFIISNTVDARKVILTAFEQGHELYISRKSKEE